MRRVTALAFALSLATAPIATPSTAAFSPWRLVSHADLHVGLRPALFVDDEGARRDPIEVGFGLTLQVTR